MSDKTNGNGNHPDIRTGDRETRDLPCKLDDAEVCAAALKASEAYNELGALEDAKKAAASSYGEQIKVKDGELATLLDQVKTRTATRPVECVEQINDRLGMGTVTIVRLDTGEIVEDERALDAEERQEDLFDLQESKPSVADVSEVSP